MTANLPLKEVKAIELEADFQHFEPERQVIVHCCLWAIPGFMVRIWRSTYLQPQNFPDRIPLLHAENISFAPVWTPIEFFGAYSFTLVFAGLPAGCSTFDLIEDIDDPLGAFRVEGIARNETDVYTVWL